MTKSCSHCLYAYDFRVYFTPLTGVLFTFPSLYLFTIGHRGVFSLGEWSPQVQTGFHVSGPTQELPLLSFQFRTRDFHPILFTFPDNYATFHLTLIVSPTTPKINFRFGLFPLRSPLLRESHLISFPLPTQMSQFSRYCFSNLCIQLEIVED